VRTGEAAAAATPAVATAVGGVVEVVTPESGVLLSHGDADGLAAAIVALASDDVRRGRMGEHGRSYVGSRFSVERLVHDIDALYRELRP